MKKRHTTESATSRTSRSHRPKNARTSGRSSQPGSTRTGEAENGVEEIIDWLRDAYAMERGVESSLEKQSRNKDLSPAVRERASMHLEQTRSHARAVESALHSLNSDTSAVKTGMGVLTQAAKGVGSMFARDERIKDLLDAYSMEHFEIACYTALAAAAEKAGLPQVVDICQSIIPDEERMADLLMGALPEEVVAYLFEAEAEEA